MKIKNISASFFVLASLIILSFAFYVGAEDNPNGSKSVFLDSDQDGLSDEEEKNYGTDPYNPDTDGDSYSDGAEVRSGYDPLKKAPGDKLAGFIATNVGSSVKSASTEPNSTVLGNATASGNLTEDIAQKIGALTEKSTTENTQVSLDDLQATIDQSFASSTVTEEDLPQINREDIKIKEQNYENLSTERAAAKRKEDCLDYLTAITYIFTSNSPTPITSLTDATGMISNILKTITTAITLQSASGLQELITSQQKIVEQLKAIEVPEDLVDIHIKALRFALYSESLGTLFQAKGGDPMGDIANLSKLQGFISVFSDFSTEVQNKLSEYNLTYDETVQNKLKSYGLDAPEDLSGLESLLNTSSTATSETKTDATTTDTTTDTAVTP
jgi:hypothetical protein